MSTRKYPHLKHKGWKHISDVNGLDLIDEAPKNLSMRSSARCGNGSYVAKDKWGTYDSHKWYQLSRKINRYLRSCVGKPYDKVYSEFKKKFPYRFGRFELAERFKYHFIEYRDVNSYWHSTDYCYYIDEQGLIQNAYLDKLAKKPKEKKLTKIKVTDSQKKYRFSDYVINDFHAKFIVRTWLPRRFDYALSGQYFSEDVYHRILNHLNRDCLLSAIYGLKSAKWWKQFKQSRPKIRYMYGISSYVVKEFLFDEWIDEKVKYVEVGSPEHKKHVAENSKKERALRKKKERELLAKMETLLHDIVNERKRKEDLKNIVDRDRLGFDEESFKWEAYHGQKRKKRSK